MIIDTSMICREEREPLHAESNYFLKRRLATFDSVGIWVPSQGPTQVKQIKAQEMETSSPRPLPSSQGTQVALWCPILAQFRRERGDGNPWPGGGDSAAGLRTHLSIQAFGVNLPSLWSFFFSFYTLTTFLHNHFPPRAFQHRGWTHSLVSHTSKGLQLSREKSRLGMFWFWKSRQVISADTSSVPEAMAGFMLPDFSRCEWLQKSLPSGLFSTLCCRKAL